MRIANPIYDVVFKYLMEDREAAILFLSSLIGEEIIELELHPQEKMVEVKKDIKCITVYRLDFVAKIKLKEGAYKKVIIEIQKAKYSTDIMRFRRYLGEQYSDRENFYCDDNMVKKALPIINIYFLGYKLNNIDCALIKVNRHYYNGVTGERLSDREEFIESLSHDSIVVQIKSLKQPYRSEIEKLLSIFDQNLRVTDHLLEIDDSDYPEKYEILIRRLLRAASEKQVIDTMDVEDDILEELENLERTIEKKEKTIEEQGKAIEEKVKALEEQGKALEEKDKALEEKDRIIMELKKKLST